METSIDKRELDFVRAAADLASLSKPDFIVDGKSVAKVLEMAHAQRRHKNFLPRIIGYLQATKDMIEKVTSYSETDSNYLARLSVIGKIIWNLLGSDRAYALPWVCIDNTTFKELGFTTLDYLMLIDLLLDQFGSDLELSFDLSNFSIITLANHDL